jgi:predicted acylesterase/phospholipase RssA
MLATTLTIDQVEDLIDKQKAFSQAKRKLRAEIDRGDRSAADMKWMRQKLALATYKDPEVQLESALEEAFEVLKAGDLGTTEDPETLSLAGAIQKRTWEISGDYRGLGRSVSYYRRARDAGKRDGKLAAWTYAAINVAFVLDLMAREEASIESKESIARAEELHKQAASERQAIVEQKDAMLAEAKAKRDWWLAATVLEAEFGLGKFDAVGATLKAQIAEFKPDDWKCESMARQLSAVADLLFTSPGQRSAALVPIEPLVQGVAARALLAGKIGLALSGGGFRASLYHVGVLARLAELDLLRHVEVLSCVSGGSILGALYYLELRRALMRTPDAGMTREKYIAVVTRVQDRLVAALRKDIRTRAMVSSFKKFGLNRTELTGGMIDTALYASDDLPSRKLRDLIVVPKGEDDKFNPKLHNWRRQAKVPILILNATTLNTGHNWQFTATWMGEAPTCIEPAIDASERLRRVYYTNDDPAEAAPNPHGDTLLATAVGSSAAVPGVFRPIALAELYKDRTVQLSDGGVHDNQGVFGLLEQDCNIFIISDGCGQLSASFKPGWMIASVLGRANSTLMETVRRGSYRLLAARRRTRRLRDLRFIHLKKGLPTEDITWIGGKKTQGSAVPPDRANPGLDERTQRALADIRTDLDNFSENECHALMYAGYRMTERDFAARPFGLAVAGPASNWAFLRVAPYLDAPTAQAKAPSGFLRELEVGSSLFFRPFRKVWRAWRGE